MKRILVAVDGSDTSKRAVAFGAGLAHQSGAELVTLTVLEPPTVLPFGFMGSSVSVPTPTEEHVESVRRTLEALHHGLPAERVQVRLEVGKASEVILAQAEALGADLIVLGSHGFANPATRWILGSVAEKVLRHANRPVTVVP